MRVVQSGVILIVALFGPGLRVRGQDGSSAGVTQVQEKTAEQTAEPAADEASPATIDGVVESKDGEVYEGVRIALTLAGPGSGTETLNSCETLPSMS